MTSPRVLYAFALTSLAIGLCAQLAPISRPHAELALLAMPTGALPDAQSWEIGSALAYDTIIATNIFSPERTAPAARFSPPGRAARPKPSGPALRLYGITAGPQGALAIIAADPSGSRAELYRLGDLVAGARLIAITDSSVTLAEPAGPLVIRLETRPRRKP